MRMRRVAMGLVLLAAAGAVVLHVAAATMPEGPKAPAGTTARIVSPAQGAILQGPDVTFTVTSSGIKVPDQGHYHLLVDDAAAKYMLGQPIPTDEKNVHFKLPPKAALKLSPGGHVVVLVVANPAHVAFVPLITDSRYVWVK